jgi:SAM-dependent methyltransferase
MPDAAGLEQMYGDHYDCHTDPGRAADSGQWRPVLALLRDRAGTFVDYGCGSGGLLQAAAAIGWRVAGVELNEAVAAGVRARTGLPAYAADGMERSMGERADVLHLGDVVEHLTDALPQTRTILALLKPGGTLIAQGPLEANTNLFHHVIRAARAVRRPAAQEMAPYHVLLATAEGQRRFFGRLGLEEMQFTISEVDWPAPARLGAKDLRHPRAVALFGLRQVSKVVSRLRPGAWGNRYFYVGRRPSPA